MKKSIVIMSQTGCLLPILILLNLFFGWMFFKPLAWIAIEGILVLLFMLNFFILARSVSSFTQKRKDVIDVEAQVLEKDIDQKRHLE